jgi:hypothetical protein
VIFVRKHTVFLSALFGLAAAFAILVALGRVNAAGRAGAEEGNRLIVATLGLTDLALWTEARYTRHPSQTDFFSPFQDLPAGMEHFPAGSLLAPPAHLVDRAAADGSASGGAGSRGR